MSEIKRVTLHPLNPDGSMDLDTGLYPKTLIDGIVDREGNEVEVVTSEELAGAVTELENALQHKATIYEIEEMPSSPIYPVGSFIRFATSIYYVQSKNTSSASWIGFSEEGIIKISWSKWSGLNRWFTMIKTTELNTIAKRITVESISEILSDTIKSLELGDIVAASDSSYLVTEKTEERIALRSVFDEDTIKSAIYTKNQDEWLLDEITSFIAASKEYVDFKDSFKVDKTSLASKIYGTDENGNQQLYDADALVKDKVNLVNVGPIDFIDLQEEQLSQLHMGDVVYSESEGGCASVTEAGSSHVILYTLWEDSLYLYIYTKENNQWNCREESIMWSELEKISNKVTSINSESTDTEYPSAKAVYDGLSKKFTNLGEVDFSETTLQQLLDAVGGFGKMFAIKKVRGERYDYCIGCVYHEGDGGLYEIVLHNIEDNSISYYDIDDSEGTSILISEMSVHSNSYAKTEWVQYLLNTNYYTQTQSDGRYAKVEQGFNVINASDIVNNTLTQAQYDLITNGKPTRIVGTLGGTNNPIILIATVSVSMTRCLVAYNTGTYCGLTYYDISNSSKIVNIRSNYIRFGTNSIGLETDNGSNISIDLDGKSLPSFPSDTTKQYKLVQQVGGTLAWVEDTPIATSQEINALFTGGNN